MWTAAISDVRRSASQWIHVSLNEFTCLPRTQLCLSSKVVQWGCKECSSCLCASDEPAFTREWGDLYSADAVYGQGCTHLSYTRTHRSIHVHRHSTCGAHTLWHSLCRPLLTPSAICVAEELCTRINRRGQYLPVAPIREECNVFALNRLIKCVRAHFTTTGIFFWAAILWR